MKVRATHDDAKEGLHFSRITNALQTGEAATFLALTLDNVAAGLAAAVNADPSGRVTATAPGSHGHDRQRRSRSRPTSPAASIDDDADCTDFAYLGDLTVSINTATTHRRRPSLAIVLDGVRYKYAAQMGNDYAKIAQSSQTS